MVGFTYSHICTFRHEAPKSSQVFRTERDTFGELNVPVDRYWGAQTQRSVSVSLITYM